MMEGVRQGLVVVEEDCDWVFVCTGEKKAFNVLFVSIFSFSNIFFSCV